MYINHLLLSKLICLYISFFLSVSLDPPTLTLIQYSLPDTDPLGSHFDQLVFTDVRNGFLE